MKKTTEKYIWNTENKKIQEIWNEQCFKCEKRTIWSTKNRMEWYNECWITTKEKQNTKFNNNREKKNHIKQNGRKLAKAAKTTNTQIDEEVTPKRFEEPRKWNVFCLFKSIVSNENPFFYSLLLCVCVFAFGVFLFLNFHFTLFSHSTKMSWAELSWMRTLMISHAKSIAHNLIPLAGTVVESTFDFSSFIFFIRHFSPSFCLYSFVHSFCNGNVNFYTNFDHLLS